MAYRVWFDPTYDKHSSEDEYGETYEAISAETAAIAFAEDQYAIKQHLDPGMVLVRDKETGELSRWSIRSRVMFSALRETLSPEDDDGQ